MLKSGLGVSRHRGWRCCIVGCGNPRGIQWCLSHVLIAKSMQKEVFGLLSLIRLLVKWAEVEMID